MCSRKYNIWLCLEYILEDVFLVNHAKTTAGPPSFAPLCSYALCFEWEYCHVSSAFFRLSSKQHVTQNHSTGGRYNFSLFLAVPAH